MARHLALLLPLVAGIATSAHTAQAQVQDEAGSSRSNAGKREQADTASPAGSRAKNSGRGKKKTKVSLPIQLYGRVVARAGLQQREEILTTGRDDVTTFDLSVWQARVGVKAQGPRKWLTAELEAELAGKVRLKDAFVQASSQGFRARFGQFRMPAPAMDMESSWDLPVVSRGLINELLEERLEIGGRRPGVAYRARTRGKTRFEWTLGAFQGSKLVDPVLHDTELLSEVGPDSQNYVGRAGMDFGSVKVGAFYTYRVGTDDSAVSAGDSLEHYPAAGVDLVVDSTWRQGGFRLWADGVVGRSWYVHNSKDVEDVNFGSGRLLAALRWGGVHREELYVEPFVLCGAFDPDLDVTADRAIEATVGINVGAWERARLGLAAGITDVERFHTSSQNFPTEYAIDDLLDRRTLILQAGVAF